MVFIKKQSEYSSLFYLNKILDKMGSRFKETTGSTSESFFLVLGEFVTYCTVSAIDHCNLQPQF